ncbi:DNA-binding transcriptional regulator, MarR family [Klenkia soli]|uniref:DNA-binding transcriptional regulator, MarR family n=1 Tax=Klenkia soli TaxID=1052260 RepID=A0A1H0RR04_9ACTN|nr:MarR family transcriptional regulator [Klenkia soli]SDP31825.1 DNA-binding transcriptional regulator, MarR family [Klenkia soli]
MSGGARRPDPVQLGAYFDLVEVVGLLRHAVEAQLREAGGLSYVQFQLLARLGDAPGGTQRMTELADGVVYSRSGLTYQADQLEKAGLVTRAAAADDDRGVAVSLTDDGKALLDRVLPGHVEVVGELFFDRLDPADTATLARLLGSLKEHMRSVPPRSARPRRPRSAAAPDTP